MTADSETELRAICPFCESITQNGNVDAKFYYNSVSGLYHCFHCLENGKDSEGVLLTELNVIDEIIKKPFNPSSLANLTGTHLELSRFLDARFPVKEGVKRPEFLYSEAQQAVALPVRDFKGEIVGVKYRKSDPAAKPRYLSETGSVNEGYWLRGSDDTKLLIVEGELDASTAMYCGFKGSVLATQTNRLNPSQLKAIKSFKNVFVLPDNDLGGVELENSCNELLGPLKATFIKLDQENSKDLNEYLQRRGYDECSKFITQVTRTELEKDTTEFFNGTSEMVEFLSNIRNTKGTATGFRSLDALLAGGIRDSEITVISARMKVGKTSFVNNLIHNKAKLGAKIGVVSLEMDGPLELSPSIISIASQSDFRALGTALDIQDFVDYCKQEYAYLNNIIYLRREGDIDWMDIEEWAKGLGIEYLVIDHAGFLTPDIKDATETRRITKAIKKFAKQTKIKIIAVVQQNRSKEEPSMQTTDGGIGFPQICHNFITLNRNKDNDMCLEAKLVGVRYPGARISSVPILLFYTRETCTLAE